MDNSRHCPQCGNELSPDAPAGLCPECLLKQGFNSEIDSQAMDKTAAMSGFIPPKPEELAEKFPQLEILELIGKGGMGAVYKARQPNLDRLVALKILPPEVGEDPAFAERFIREARALARLNHPHVVAVYDFGVADGLFYFIMEYVDGTNIRQLIQAGSVNPQQALAVVPQICEALQFAHEEGIVHRDIKPENILIDKKGRVKIADFGLAKMFGGADGSPVEKPFTLTGTHQVMGTVHYMAPEQIEHPLKVDHRADIYSLGVVFYEMLTGELPIGRFAAPSEKVQIDVRLDEVVLRSLEKEPEKRYQHASDVKTELDSIASRPLKADKNPQPPGVKSQTTPPTAGKLHPVSRNIAIGICLLGMGLIFFPWVKVTAVLYKTQIDHDYIYDEVTFNYRSGLDAVQVAQGSDIWQGTLICGVFFVTVCLLVISQQSSRMVISDHVTLILASVAILFLTVSVIAEQPRVLNIMVHWPQMPTNLLAEVQLKQGTLSDIQFLKGKLIRNSTSLISESKPALYVNLFLAASLLLLVRVGAYQRKNESRRLSEKSESSSEKQIPQQLHDVSVGLMIAGAINCLCLLGWFTLAYYGRVLSVRPFGGGEEYILSWLFFSAVMGIFILFAAFKMRQVEGYRISMFGSMLAVLPVTPGALVGIPVGLWALAVLTKKEVKAAFPHKEIQRQNTANTLDVASIQQRVKGVADGLIVVAGIALLTAIGVGLWLWGAALPASQLQSHQQSMTISGLKMMSATHVVYSIFVIAAAVLMRQLRARMFVLLCVTIAGIAFPAGLALNVIMELEHIPEWPVVIPMWLGMPIAVWATVVLFRQETRVAFEEKSKTRDASVSIKDSPVQPRFSRKAILGALWAPLFFIMMSGFLMTWTVRTTVHSDSEISGAGEMSRMEFSSENRTVENKVESIDSSTKISSLPQNRPSQAVSERVGPSWWQWLLMFTVLPVGLIAPFGTTILGTVGISDIRHSQKRLVGLPLAIADALFFPLLVLDTLIVWGVFLFIALCLNVLESTTGTIVRDPAISVSLSILIGFMLSAIVDFRIARAVWRRTSATG